MFEKLVYVYSQIKTRDPTVLHSRSQDTFEIVTLLLILIFCKKSALPTLILSFISTKAARGSEGMHYSLQCTVI